MHTNDAVRQRGGYNCRVLEYLKRRRRGVLGLSTGLLLSASLLPADALAQPAPEPAESAAPVAPTDPPVAPAPAQPPATVGAEAAPAAEAGVDQPPLPSGQQRPLPNYDGREDEPVDAGDVLIWIPRAVFSPVYLVSEYVLRWPLGQIVSALDVNDVPNILADFFTFGPGDKSGLVPSALLDFGFRPSIGLYFFSDDVIVDGFGIRANVAYGGNDWYLAKLATRYTIQEESATDLEHTIDLSGSFVHRPDWRFHGIGSDTTQDAASRYAAQYIEGTLRYVGGVWRSSRIEAWAGVRDVLFKEEGCCDDRALVEGVAEGLFERPPLYDDGYLIARVGAEAVLDTRERRNAYEGDGSDHVSPSGSGFKLAGRADFGFGLRDSPASVPDGPDRIGFVRYGGTAGAFVDVYNQRVIGLQLIADFVDPLKTDAPIPFTELASLGGARPLRGFLQNRLLGDSSIVAHLEYRWPIWALIDGVAHYSVGNVFGKHLDGFAAEKLRQSFGFGLRATGARDHAFELLIAGGTSTFEQGSSVDSFRFVLGSSAGF